LKINGEYDINCPKFKEIHEMVCEKLITDEANA